MPSLEAAYRSSRWRGFSCTSSAPLPATVDAAAAGAAEPPSVRFVPWKRGTSQQVQAAADGSITLPLPIPYSLPPQRYAAGDHPWMVDKPFPGLDLLGCAIDGKVGTNYGLLESMAWPPDA